MNIVLGLTEEDIKTISLIRATICNLYDEKDFPDDPTEIQQRRYDDWKMMSDVISKIGFVIENQTEIDKTATGMIPTAVCQNGSLLSDEEIRCVRKMIKELNLDHL